MDENIAPGIDAHRIGAGDIGGVGIVDAGGDIFIHGGPRPKIDRTGADWTAGCIAVTNREIEEVYA
ncbi:MAG: L,D-transpeptidase, partial [Pseudomonadota bacterium]